LVHSLNHLQGDLKNVEGLVEVKEILEAKKEVSNVFLKSNRTFLFEEV